MSFFNGPRIVTDGLIIYLDSADLNSYISGSSSWQDLVTGYSSTIGGTYGYDTTSYGVPILTLNNTSSSNGFVTVATSQSMNSLATSSNFTVMFAAKKNYYGIGGNNVGNSEFFSGVLNGYNQGWRIYEGRTGATGSVFSGSHIWYFDFPGITASLSVGDNGASDNRMNIVAYTMSPTTIFGFANNTTGSRSNPQTYSTGSSYPQISYTGAGVGSFNGLVGFFMVYNRALSYSEILQNYNTVKTRYNLK